MVVAVAVVVGVGWFLDDTLQELWWLVAVVGVGVGLVDLLVLNRNRAAQAETPVHASPSSSESAQMPPPQPAPFEPVTVGDASGAGWGSHPLPDPPGASLQPEMVRSEAPLLSGVAPGAGSTTAFGAPTDGAGLDAPTVPAQPITATSTPDMPAPALVRRASEPGDAVWRSDALWTPKSSHEWADHEDAWAIDDTLGRAALADGASSAFMARQWAMAITARFLDDPPSGGHSGFDRWITRATEQWATDAPEGDGSASWWAGASEQRGSYATLMGIRLEPEESDDVIGFTATAVGDSCMVHLTPDDKAWKRALAFPLERPEDFGKHPELVATAGARSDGSIPVVRSASGQLRRGDALVLLSDALAQFALEIDRAGDRSIWSWLMTAGQQEFCATIDKARGAAKIEDDDSTLVRILV